MRDVSILLFNNQIKNITAKIDDDEKSLKSLSLHENIESILKVYPELDSVST